MKDLRILLVSFAIVLGLSLNGFFIGRSIERFKKEDRFIAVKGFSEQEVKSDFAIWTIKTRITTNNLSDGSKKIEDNKKKIINFLTQKGISKDEIIQHNFSVHDKLATDYVNNVNTNNGDRYIIENTIQIRSNNVDTVQIVSKMTDELLKAGVVVSSSDDYRAVQYLYTKLNAIKPKMLSEATQNAMKAASEFAKEGKVGLGGLRKASQGLFSIVDRDDFMSNQNMDYASSQSDIYKKIKVVVNCEYSIK